jgi:hypothetical protein
MAREDQLPWHTLEAVELAARGFLDPLFRDQVGSWSPAEWAWSMAKR